MVTVKHDELSDAFAFVSSGESMGQMAYISLDTGAIYWISHELPDELDEVPADLETSDRYIAIPHKNDLDLGTRLARRFAEERLPHRYADVVHAFSHRGAYQHFKRLLVAEGALEAWYAYEEEATERALREWCDVNGIEVRP